MIYAKEIMAILAAYVLGCFSTGYYLLRLRTGEDIRNHGSGSAGARNVGRVLGTPGFFLTFLGDFAKGAITVWGAVHLGLRPWGVILALLAVVLGHIWPVQLQFRGGKGIATALGALLVLDYRLVLLLLIPFGLTLALTRQFTLSGLSTLALSPFAAVFMGRPQAQVYGIIILTLLILAAHRENLRVILNRITSKDSTGSANSQSTKGGAK